MNNIIISRGVRPLRNGKISAKSYPYWDDLIALLKDYCVLEINELPLIELEPTIRNSLVVICPDSFIQHYCWSINKQAIVLWGQSDPLIFGHKENINLLKDRKYLRPNQFELWEDVPYKTEAFVAPQDIYLATKRL